ncbi:hypothetical protein [Absidia glauca]|uniref:Uncharacterized protein n=1 Tax=Absidia glauca TaxID=4829 RepID=A0A163JZN8_ABSGL|nr:hypothetical protein [Absidia glauca]
MKLEQMMTDTKEKQQEIDRVDMKLERYGGTLSERERNIAELQVDLAKEEKLTDIVEAKLNEAQSANLRIQAMVEKLQET